MKIRKKIYFLIVFIACVGILVFFNREEPSECEKNLKLSKLITSKVARKLKHNHGLFLGCFGGSTTSNKARQIYSYYAFSYDKSLSNDEIKIKFLLTILEVLCTTNNYKGAQKLLVDNPFTIQNLTLWLAAEVENEGYYPYCRMLNHFGEIKLILYDIKKNEREFRLSYEELYKKFYNKIPEYLRETARQNLHCPFPDRRAVLERNNRIKLDEP